MDAGDGDDLLNSNGGDTMTGGDGADTFHFRDFRGGPGPDPYAMSVVTDFDPATDHLSIEADGYPPTLTSGPNADGTGTIIYADGVAVVDIQGVTVIDLDTITIVV